MAVTAGVLQSCNVVPAAPRARQVPVGRSTAVHVQARSAVLRRSDSSASALHCRLVPAYCRLRQPQVQCSAASAADGQGFADDSKPGSVETPEPLGKTLYLGALFGGWYAFNILFNIYNKKALKAFPYPLTCTAIQFGIGSLMALTMWALRLHERPKLEEDTLKNISPLALVHSAGNTLTNVSLGRVAVSFTHTIKAMEPFFSVLLSWLFLGEAASAPVLLSLLPIVGGVAAASVSEVTFDWGGFAAAMGSNISFQSRNVLSKKFMIGGKGLDNINLFSIITIMAFCLLAPIAIVLDGVKFTPAAMRAVGIADTGLVMRHVLLAALCFHSYQQVSYMILQRVSPVTHSIGNCLKRVIVIVTSVIVFQNPMSRQNMIGTAVALAGVFAYSQVKRLSGKKKTA